MDKKNVEKIIGDILLFRTTERQNCGDERSWVDGCDAHFDGYRILSSYPFTGDEPKRDIDADLVNTALGFIDRPWGENALGQPMKVRTYLHPPIDGDNESRRANRSHAYWTGRMENRS